MVLQAPSNVCEVVNTETRCLYTDTAVHQNGAAVGTRHNCAGVGAWGEPIGGILHNELQLALVCWQCELKVEYCPLLYLWWTLNVYLLDERDRRS